MLFYFYNEKLKQVLELDLSLAEIRKFSKTKDIRKATIQERISYLENKKQESLTDYYQLKDGMLDVYFLSPQGRKDGYSTVSDFMIKYAKRFGVFLNRNYTGQKIGLLYDHPTHIDELPTPYKIVYTGFESSKMPEEWKTHLEKADEVWVFSEWCAKVMKKSLGITPKVFYHGIDTEVFHPKARKPSDKFVFLHYDAFKWRKGWDLLLNAFEDAFGDKDDILLILKTGGQAVLPLDYPNVKILKEPASDSRMCEIMNQADCFVFPSRGEGFGMPPLEALACGVPCITINAHGISDYFNEYFIGVPFKEIRAKYDSANYKGRDLGKMYEADVKELSKALKLFYKKHKSFQYYNKLRPYAEKYSAEKCVSKMVDRLKEVQALKIEDTRPLLSIIVLTYNALEYTKKCLKSIAENTTVDYELILIDNLSTDNSQMWISENLPKMFKKQKLILNRENKGVAGGRNQGIEASNGIYCCFLDNDVEVGLGWDNRILNHFANNSELWVVGHGGNYVHNYSPLIFQASSKQSEVGYVDVVAGYCFAFPKKIVELIGNQFEGFGKFWHEDLEFCGRVRKYGKLIMEDKGISVVHHEHKSAGDNVKTNEQVKEVHSGFYEKAKTTGQRLSDKNVLALFRDYSEPSSAYTIIANNLTKHLRNLGLVVLRKETIPFGLTTRSRSFDLCNGFDMSFNGLNLGFQHCENNISPKSWIKDMQMMDYSFTCSPASLQAMLDGGLPRQKLIDYTLSGFDASLFTLEGEVAKCIPKTGIDFEKFTFFNVGASQPRKGTDILIRAFAEEFSKDEPVQLLIKNYNYGKHSWVLELASQYDANILAIYDDWKPQDVAKVYRACGLNGCYVSPHRAEGFGMPIVEAISCGMRVVATKFGGVCKTSKGLDTVKLIDYKLTDSSFHNNLAEPFYDFDEKPQWAEVDIEQFKKAMRKMYEEEYNQDRAFYSSQGIQKYSFEERAKGMFNILKKL